MSLTKKLWIRAGTVIEMAVLIGIIGLVACGGADPSPVAVKVAVLVDCPSSEEQEYLDAIKSDLIRLSTLTIMMSEDLARPAENLHLYKDDLWRMTMENHFYVSRRSADTMLEHDPPASASKLAALIERMVGDYKDAMDLYEGGIANLDSDMMQAADDKITLATDYVSYIRGEMASFCQSRGR